MVKIALFQPCIPQNVGAMMRLGACMGVRIEIIEPCGFPWDEKKMQRAGMDYMSAVDYARHSSWDNFLEDRGEGRLVLMSTKADTSYLDFEFSNQDVLLAGSESSGAPDFVHAAADARITIPIKPGLRSLNIVNATAMILGEALRQTEHM